MGTTAVLRHSAPAAANSRREVPWKDAHRRIDQSPCAVCVVSQAAGRTGKVDVLPYYDHEAVRHQIAKAPPAAQVRDVA